MAKTKVNNKRKTKQQASIPENSLPQNILPMGERVEENKNIYITQETYKKIHKFTQNKTTNESGGILVGSVVDEFGKTNILISGFIEAKFCDATPTTLKFTHETWEYIHKEIDKKYSGKKIVGWIHTHPDFGIFLSEYDKFIHENFFSEQNQIAYVIDPIQGIEGFYFWINEKLEKCNGFYIYDKTGVSIDIDSSNNTAASEEKKEKLFSFKNLLIGVLTVAVVFLLFANHSVNSEIEKLKAKQQTYETAITNMQTYLYWMQSLLYSTGNGSTEQTPETDGSSAENSPETMTEDGVVSEAETTTSTETEDDNE